MPEIWAAAQKAVRLKIGSNGEKSSHGYVHMGLSAATLGMGNEAYGRIQTMATGKSMYSSLMCSHEPKQRIYNVDANGAMPEIINRMLVYAQPGLLELLPAVPDALPKGRLEGIRAIGQIHVERLAWDTDARELHAVLTSEIKQTLSLKTPHDTSVIHVQPGKPVTLDISW
jgi:hypothetical protein